MNSAPAIRLGRLSDLARTCIRQASTYRGPPRKGPGIPNPEGHGEKIWIFSHRKTNQIIYSLKETLDGFHGHKQIPFNGKKLKQAKLRKDYWYQLAEIEFPAGQGAIGRSAFQKLRELKHLHEVSWGDEMLYKRPDEYTDARRKMAQVAESKGRQFKVQRSKFERGQALNALKPFSVADMAVVLAGHGAGNKVVTRVAEDGTKQLADVTIRWSNDQDKMYAEAWSANVTHDLLENHAWVSGTDEAELGPEAPKQIGEPAAEQATEGAAAGAAAVASEAAASEALNAEPKQEAAATEAAMEAATETTTTKTATEAKEEPESSPKQTQTPPQ